MQRANLCHHPLSVGFDRMFERMEQMHQTSQKASTYPPYNIIKNSDSEYRIEMAVAGFTIDQLDIVVQDGELTVTGNVNAQEDGELLQYYIHRGLASRPFNRKFTLADSVEVRGASLDNGILSIVLENVIPEHKKPKKIEIGTSVESEGIESKKDLDLLLE